MGVVASVVVGGGGSRTRERSFGLLYIDYAYIERDVNRDIPCATTIMIPFFLVRIAHCEHDWGRGGAQTRGGCSTGPLPVQPFPKLWLWFASFLFAFVRRPNTMDDRLTDTMVSSSHVDPTPLLPEEDEKRRLGRVAGPPVNCHQWCRPTTPPDGCVGGPVVCGTPRVDPVHGHGRPIGMLHRNATWLAINFNKHCHCDMVGDKF